MEDLGKTPPSGDIYQKTSVKVLKKLSYTMDEAFRIPGTNFRFGLDPLIGLIPGVGDTISVIISSLTLVTVARSGGDTTLLSKMGLNLLIDYLIGLVPGVGDIADAGFKANKKNLNLLIEYYEKHPEAASKTSKTVIWFALFIVGVLLGVIYLGYLMISSLF